ncbi:M20/M25/M40 family metallo-hydrolase [Stratiformator vulcanicus]|uniref:Carboxypeptidase G2 n=1 Tax=Stratiformator vulcanicus TaxID=2527980 RepID=A0A517R5M7_9PLAN|nr:M20/M25/M40 family metallo-hydrolase [Stratiformator vulcanicus]QDT39206.1 Carboxypeptidase G2 precursor [Stratiformator vulcanicus]
MKKRQVDRAESLVLELLRISGTSGREAAVAAFVEKRLLDAGCPPAAIRHDTANRKSPFRGETGNLIVKLPGRRRGSRRLLMAHLDTVPLADGAVPVRRGTKIYPKHPTTALGADDRAGVAVVLHTATQLLNTDADYPPLTLLFCVQEEIGLRGCRYLSTSALGRPAQCFNFDGRDPREIIIGATGDVAINIDIEGVASHAGVHPERGINAATVAAVAIADLQANGWLGLIEKGEERGTSNVGSVIGGSATNVVMPQLSIRAEARSHSHTFRQRIVDEYRAAFERAVAVVQNHERAVGKFEFNTELKYESFRLSPGDKVVQSATNAVRAVGLEPEFVIGNGGLDANWMNAHGQPTATFGCGQHNIHTVDEFLDLGEFATACDIAMHLATADLA